MPFSMRATANARLANSWRTQGRAADGIIRETRELAVNRAEDFAEELRRDVLREEMGL